MKAREVIAKGSLFENGIGSINANPIWESNDTEYGDFVRLDRAKDGRLFFTFTDMEEFNGAYSSVEVKQADLDSLVALIAPAPRPDEVTVALDHVEADWLYWLLMRRLYPDLDERPIDDERLGVLISKLFDALAPAMLAAHNREEEP